MNDFFSKFPITENDLPNLKSGGEAFAIINQSKALRLEEKGWEDWLRTLFPSSFSAPFSDFQREFWDNWWQVCWAIKLKKEIDPQLLNYMLLWGRGLAKSSSGTPSSVMKACFQGSIYSIFVSNTKSQAQLHLGNARLFLTKFDARLTEFYPDMELLSNVPTNLGVKSKDASELFITKGGAVFQAIGLDSAVRGANVGGKRPDDYNCDDLDDLHDSPAVSQKNLSTLTRSVLLTRETANETVVTAKILQNLIIEHGLVNSIHTGQSDAFANRTTIGVVNTFETLDIQSYTDEKTMRTRHKILPSSRPTWVGVSIKKAQDILDLTGLDGFMAECQNDFSGLNKGLILYNYDDNVHVISQSEFESVYKTREMPQEWNKDWAGDYARTKSKSHASVAFWRTISSADSELPAMEFIFYPMSFAEATGGTDIGLRVLSQITPFAYEKTTWEQLKRETLIRENAVEHTKTDLQREEYERKALIRVISPYASIATRNHNVVKGAYSHERDDIVKTLNKVFGLKVQGVNPKTYGGIDQINEKMKVDYERPHPFRQGENGFCRFFIVVPDNEADNSEIPRPRPYPKEIKPDSLVDSDLIRYQFKHWKTRPEVVTDAGSIIDVPVKENDDFPNAFQMLEVLGTLKNKELSAEQEYAVLMKKRTASLPKYEEATEDEQFMIQMAKGAIAQFAQEEVLAKRKPRNDDDYFLDEDY